MTHRSPRLALVALAIVCAAVSAGCDGDEPTPPSTTTETTTGSQPTTTQETSSVAVYFLRGEKVSPVRRAIAATPAVARTALTELLAGPTEEEVASGLKSAVPAGTGLRDVSISGGVATVDLDGTFDHGGGSASMLGRVAQVVATLTRFPTVDRVAFRIDGRPVEAIGAKVSSSTRRSGAGRSRSRRRRSSSNRPCPETPSRARSGSAGPRTCSRPPSRST